MAPNNGPQENESHPNHFNDTRESMCASKATFTSMDAARQVGRRRRQRAYQCPHCWKFHLTTHDRLSRYDVTRFVGAKKRGKPNRRDESDWEWELDEEMDDG